MEGVECESVETGDVSFEICVPNEAEWDFEPIDWLSDTSRNSQLLQESRTHPENDEVEEVGRALGVWCFMPCYLSSLLRQCVALKALEPAAAGGPSIHRDARVL